MLATREAGDVADQAEERKKAKYVDLQSSHLFVPVTIETARAFGQEALTFLQLRVGAPSLGEDWRASVTPPAAAEDCRGHAAGQHSRSFGYHDCTHQ